MHRSSFVLGFVLALLPGSLLAESFKNPPAQPLLVIRSFHTPETVLSNLPPDPRVFLTTLFIFYDRTLVRSISVSPEPFGIRPQLAEYTRGKIPFAVWNNLRSSMTVTGIDSLQSCRFFRPGAQQDPASNAIGETVINWHGRTGRKNSFTMTSGGGDASACQANVLNLIGAIFEAAEHVERARTSEHFVSP
jgi:hypothetical protein